MGIADIVHMVALAEKICCKCRFLWQTELEKRVMPSVEGRQESDPRVDSTVEAAEAGRKWKTGHEPSRCLLDKESQTESRFYHCCASGEILLISV